MKLTRLSLLLIGIYGLTASLSANLKSDKITLQPNMIVVYDRVPNSVDTLSDAFKKGMFYGRIRMNNFRWNWQKENLLRKDNYAMGIGGSLVYKSAPLAGVSATVGLYTSQNPSFANMDKQDVFFVKAGKDTFSRNKVRNSGHFGMTVVAQAYLQYDIAETTFKGGRQLYKSVFTASNDTKMIPNSFDGVTLHVADIPQTSIDFAYFTAQKLRDHTSSHDVLAYNGFDENDDSGANKSLTVNGAYNTQKIGNSNTLIIGSLTNKSIKNLKLKVSYMMVPNIVSNLALEAYYSLPVNETWKITPGIRYMKQFDNLGSSKNVANLRTRASVANGYSDPTSLDASLLALRLDIAGRGFLGRIGYSHIADKADIIAPWRGFPTGGFTRAMGQYNWYANTTTYMLQAGYDFNKENIISGFSAIVRYAIQDFDNVKAAAGATQSDSDVLHIDFRQHVANDLEVKLRVAFVNAAVDTDSYNECRLEFNYFF